MPFTARDFQSLVRALERHAEWKAELRRLLLSDDVLALPQTVSALAQEVRELVAGQARLTEQVRELAVDQARLTDQVRELATGQARLTDQVRELATDQARLTEQVRELASGQARLTEHVRELAVDHARLTDQVRELASGQARLTEQVGELASGQARLTEQVRELATGHARLTDQLSELATDQARLVATQNQLTTDVRALVAAMQSAVDRLGELEGDSLERRYRERAAGLFQQIVTRIRVLDHQELALLLDDAVDAGTLTPEEKAEVLRADVILRGRRDRRETYVLAEVSAVIDAADVRRAAARARLLQRAVGAPVLPVVAGQRLADDAAHSARALDVWRLLDGQAEAPAGGA
jgi:peptidoglycan hydrolase CwlO-like protein